MPAEPGGRPLLPHAQNFTFVSSVPAQAQPQQRNYVFVDEHNRHKRLKVMRACEGCRRRKIKCDAATTNTWPCAACTRLKLTCVPPTISYENDPGDAPGVSSFAIDSSPQSYGVTSSPTAPAQDDYKRPYNVRQPSTDALANYTSATAPGNYGAAQMYSSPSYSSQAVGQSMLHYDTTPQSSVTSLEPRYQPDVLYPSSVARHVTPTVNDEAWQADDDVSSSVLAEAMGELKIGPEAVAPWMKQTMLAEEPAVGEVEIQLPTHTNADMTIRIPPEMMPSERKALHYFDYYFTNINPYIPVVHRANFYQQWQANRDQISPLMLEAMFACVSFMLEDHAEGNKWLALAAKHEESFKDVPRLSTIQALVILLKARESSPKRGYYYRSWMTIVNMVAMAKDLELHEHFENHELGISCGSSAAECLTKTRVWNQLFFLEIIIGGAQGRFDYGVRHETVDFNIPTSVPGRDEVELQISRQFAYFLRIARNISVTNAILGRLRKKRKDWAVDPEFYGHNHHYQEWERDLPADLQVVFPEDGSLPWIPSHFVANMHSYHLLTVIMQHRSQMITRNKMHDPTWKDHMDLCFDSARKLCVLEEATLRDYGLQGLAYMQRGLSFTIYTVLTCNMINLAAITSPDLEVSAQARDCFAREMRILERCIPSWPMPEVIAQINSLREAFSADTNKPFELRANFPYGSPAMSQQSPPLGVASYPAARQSGHEQGPVEQPAQSMVMMAPDQQQQQVPMSMANTAPPLWSPSRIFDQWTVAFGMQSKAPSEQSASPPLPGPSSTSPGLMMPGARVAPGQESLLQQPLYSAHHNLAQHTNPVHAMPAQRHPAAQAPVAYTPSAVDSFVTPSMWQDVVASSFPDGGLKRRWDYGGQSSLAEPMIKRAR